MIHPLRVVGFGYLAPHAPSLDLQAGVTSEPPKLDLTLLERTLRRGLSDVTRLFMHAAKLALSDASANESVEPAQVHVIFASAFGEIGTAEAMLAEAYDSNSSSPARFRNSVHNTAPGLFSISNKNHLPSTAVAAGWETIAMGLCEAAAVLATGRERVLLVFAEERVPSALSVEHDHGPLAAGFVLSRSEGERGRSRATLSLPRRCARSQLAADTSIRYDDHPLAPVLRLAQMLEQHRSGRLAVSDGDAPWCVDVEASLS